MTAPVVHLEGPGAKLDQGRASLGVTFSGTGAALYRLQDSVDGGSYATVGPGQGLHARTVAVVPSASTTHRFRVIPYDAFEVQGVRRLRVDGPGVAKSEAPSAVAPLRGRLVDRRGPRLPRAGTRACPRPGRRPGHLDVHGPRGRLGRRQGPAPTATPRSPSTG